MYYYVIKMSTDNDHIFNNDKSFNNSINEFVDDLNIDKLNVFNDSIDIFNFLNNILSFDKINKINNAIISNSSNAISDSNMLNTLNESSEIIFNTLDESNFNMSNNMCFDALLIYQISSYINNLYSIFDNLYDKLNYELTVKYIDSCLTGLVHNSINTNIAKSVQSFINVYEHIMKIICDNLNLVLGHNYLIFYNNYLNLSHRFDHFIKLTYDINIHNKLCRIKKIVLRNLIFRAVDFAKIKYVMIRNNLTEDEKIILNLCNIITKAIYEINTKQLKLYDELIKFHNQIYANEQIVLSKFVIHHKQIINLFNNESSNADKYIEHVYNLINKFKLIINNEYVLDFAKKRLTTFDVFNIYKPNNVKQITNNIFNTYINYVELIVRRKLHNESRFRCSLKKIKIQEIEIHSLINFFDI